ncbi:glycoside hydrolase family 16 protein [Tilletiaria anomala UBC 951]|uniref:Glycoside hydrolase family 16 protein n=1 Tax=Tilletiaria anomala (strain ATCC 24038 / CBS 436.72 / UBC 951) TaxID=1037660 RepID=A0A066WCG1_TILAU|nr:glycoside hydrolase family 16 protein [Tilletiaria anomala UBC 951]KDN51421.1 glycoside hydrolase family 16 protein [Tilletiaria anomala UBC 951]
MTVSRSSCCRRAWVALCLLVASYVGSAVAQTISCSSASQCPSSAPCCSSGGQCGNGAQFCSGGCNPLSSHSPTSCNPAPVCQTQNITLRPADFNNSNIFMPILSYNGTASTPFTLEYGSLGAGSEGVILQLTNRTQGMLSTTQYMLYGDVEATIRHNAQAGIVAAFIFMSDVKDEIDWEFTTANEQDTQTNTYALGDYNTKQPQTLNQSGTFSVGDWHTYGVNWQPDYIQWKIDGNVVRTLYANSTHGNFPQTPSRLQLSIWAGGSSQNDKGTIAWSGGAIDWGTQEYQQNGYYSHEIKNFYMGCAPQNTGNIATTGSGQGVTSYVYTGQNITGTNRPEFQMSTNPISAISNPSAGGVAGVPGYAGTETPKVTNGNSWDGSGKSMADTVRAASGATTSKQAVDDGSGSNADDSSPLNPHDALKYGVPIVASVIGAIVIWGIALAFWRRSRNKRIAAQSQSGISGGMLGPAGASYSSIGALGTSAGKYSALPRQDMDDDVVPLGAERKGFGYGPAAGPSPAPGMRNVGRGVPIAGVDVAAGGSSGFKFVNNAMSPRQSTESYALGSFASTPRASHSVPSQYQMRGPPAASSPNRAGGPLPPQQMMMQHQAYAPYSPSHTPHSARAHSHYSSHSHQSSLSGGYIVHYGNQHSYSEPRYHGY